MFNLLEAFSRSDIAKQLEKTDEERRLQERAALAEANKRVAADLSKALPAINRTYEAALFAGSSSRSNPPTHCPRMACCTPSVQ